MYEACLFDILALPEDSLRRVLPKASTRVVTRLMTAYPRSVGRAFLDILTQTMSPATLTFLKDEMHAAQLPSYHQIREAEKEFFKLIHEEQPAARPS